MFASALTYLLSKCRCRATCSDQKGAIRAHSNAVGRKALVGSLSEEAQSSKSLEINITWSKQEYPLNLSISLSGGKEINKDYLSRGDWTGKSPRWKSLSLAASCNLINKEESSRISFLGTGRQRGWNPRIWREDKSIWMRMSQAAWYCSLNREINFFQG